MTMEVEVRWNVPQYDPIVREAVNEVAKDIRDRARMDIPRAGHFGSRFITGLRTHVNKVEGGYKFEVATRPAFAKVFEYGGTSVGHPLLWIPVAPDSKRIRAKVYPRLYAKLYRPRGKNVLISTKDKKVKYVGVRSTTNRPRFHIRQIAIEEANKYAEKMLNAIDQV